MNINSKAWVLISVPIRAILFFSALTVKSEFMGVRITLIAIVILFIWSLIEFILRNKKKHNVV
jgi:hypothetical protein